MPANWGGIFINMPINRRDSRSERKRLCAKIDIRQRPQKLTEISESPGNYRRRNGVPDDAADKIAPVTR